MPSFKGIGEGYVVKSQSSLHSDVWVQADGCSAISCEPMWCIPSLNTVCNQPIHVFNSTDRYKSHHIYNTGDDRAKIKKKGDDEVRPFFPKSPYV